MGLSAMVRWGCLVALVAGCGGGTTQRARVSSPWQPEMAEFFDDAADFIEDPGDLGGTWASSYGAELQGRVDLADLICRVHITTINEDINVDGYRRKHLLTRITSTLAGRGPADGRLSLMVDQGGVGFDAVDRGERRLFNNRFVAFVRWYEGDQGEVRAHWHLSPDTRPLVELVRRRITEREVATPGRSSLP